MPEKKTVERAKEARRKGKSPSTQAGAFVKEQMDHIREGKHGARSTKQAIAIGLSEARRAGVDLKAPKKGAASDATRRKAKTDDAAGQRKKAGSHAVSPTRSRATTNALQRESRQAASPAAISKHSHAAASRRGAASRSAAASKAAQTKGAAGRSAAAKKAARTRAAKAV